MLSDLYCFIWFYCHKSDSIKKTTGIWTIRISCETFWKQGVLASFRLSLTDWLSRALLTPLINLPPADSWVLLQCSALWRCAVRDIDELWARGCSNPTAIRSNHGPCGRGISAASTLRYSFTPLNSRWRSPATKMEAMRKMITCHSAHRGDVMGCFLSSAKEMESLIQWVGSSQR